MTRIFTKPRTLSDILHTDVLRANVEIKTTEELCVGTALAFINNAWTKATDTNVANAERVAVLLENAYGDGVYGVLLIGVISNVTYSETIKKALFKSNIIID